MSVATKDGAWLHATPVVEISCSQCGRVAVTSPKQQNVDAAIRLHARNRHGGEA